VPVRESAYTPEELTVQVGLYDFTSGERMTRPDGESFVIVGGVKLVTAQHTEVPNPLSINFGGQMALVGYAVENRVVAPEDTLKLSLYWEAVQTMEANYTISVQLLGEGGTNIGQIDSWPRGGDYPTSAWDPGDTIEDTMEIPISAGAAPGVYNVQIVVYQLNEAGEIERLARITDDGRIVDDFILLTEIRVAE
jgi:hypothetical protein